MLYTKSSCQRLKIEIKNAKNMATYVDKDTGRANISFSITREHIRNGIPQNTYRTNL